MLLPPLGDWRAVTGLVKLPNSCIVSIYPYFLRNGKPSVMHPSSTAIASIGFVVCMHVARFPCIEECVRCGRVCFVTKPTTPYVKCVHIPRADATFPLHTDRRYCTLLWFVSASDACKSWVAPCT
jgi:hypothetical protein